MKVWVQRLLDGGAPLAQPLQIGEPHQPLELLVLHVTDQGQRRPTKVARLVPLGQRQAIDELIMPKLFWMKKGHFVLSGTEQQRQAHRVKGCAQSWLCQWAQPAPAEAFRVVPLYRYGEPIPRRELNDRHVNSLNGKLLVGSVMDQVLGRATVRADIVPAPSAYGDGRRGLLDANLEWMSSDGFELSGFEQVGAHADEAAITLQQGWLCKLDGGVPGAANAALSHRKGREER